MDVKETLNEGFRITRASERLGSLIYPLKATLETCHSVLDIAPELEPEVDEIRKRVEETIAHVVAAGAVLSAKLEMID